MVRSKTPSYAAPDWSGAALSRDDLIARVCSQGAKLYRELPWRNVGDAYGVLVSEVMLQQTQVTRVMRYWERWMALFPTVDALAAADVADVLGMWQGLGYNRRALALKRACETCSAQFGGELPRTVEELVELPGIGPATAAGIVAFAFDRPAMYLETNVRSVFLHELFPHCEGVTDKQLAPFVSDTCPVGMDGGADFAGITAGEVSDLERAELIATSPRAWYYALLDYGAHLKTQVTNPSRRSAHHSRQSKFEGSHREKRSFVLKFVLAEPQGASAAEVREALDAFERDAGRGGIDAGSFDSIVAELVREGFFRQEGDLLIA